MFNLSVTPEILAYILAALVALLFDWFPGLAAWYAMQNASRKRQVMGVVLGGVTLLIYAGICGSVFITQIACDKAGFVVLIQIFAVSVGINQGVHALFKPSKSDPITWTA
jgi:hypothetical protein